jgi:hypothetical protein
MVECVAQGDFEGGRRALEEHMGLLRYRPEEAEAESANSISQAQRYFE